MSCGERLPQHRVMLHTNYRACQPPIDKRTGAWRLNAFTQLNTVQVSAPVRRPRCTRGARSTQPRNPLPLTRTPSTQHGPAQPPNAASAGRPPAERGPDLTARR